MTYKSMLILQSCRDLEKCVPVPCSETYATPSHNANQAMNIKVEELSDIEVEEHPVPITFTGLKSEHEVSCKWLFSLVTLSVCLLILLLHLHTLQNHSIGDMPVGEQKGLIVLIHMNVVVIITCSSTSYSSSIQLPDHSLLSSLFLFLLRLIVIFLFYS
jgi:hypothetical protein